MALSQKQKTFCETYAANGGNATDAARVAGYANPNKASHENMVKHGIKAYIDKLTKDSQSKRIATKDERQEFWSSLLRGDLVDFDADGNPVQAKMSDRVRASELLGKSQLDFIERKELTGAGGKDLGIKVVFDE